MYTITNAINLIEEPNDCPVSIQQWGGNFPKTDKNEIVIYHSKNMKRFKSQSVQVLHYRQQFLLLPSQIPLFRYSSSIYKIIWSFMLEIQLNFTFLLKKNSNSQYIGLQLPKRKCCCCCYSSYNKWLSFVLYSHILKKCSF